MDWYPLWNSLRIALISCAAVFFLGIFASLVEKLFMMKFERKSVAEQDNLIFIKLMENEYAQDTVKSVKSAMKADQGVSRTTLYKMIYNHESDNDVVQFCNNCNLSA